VPRLRWRAVEGFLPLIAAWFVGDAAAARRPRGDREAEPGQGTAARHDPETTPVDVDELADQRCSGSHSRAKKADAAFRISIVRSSSPTLRFSSRTSFADSVLTPAA
jgi:hypothetical protein